MNCDNCIENYDNYKYLLTCEKEALPWVEMALFRLEFENNPGIEPFYIVADNQIFYYNVIKQYDKYFIVTK